MAAGSGSEEPGRPERILAALRSLPGRLADAWRRLRAWRRIYFTRGGILFSLGAFSVGFAAMNTGNNLLFLLLGAMLGSIVLSGWLSERAIRGLEIRRRLPRGVPVEKPARLVYEVTNRKARLPSLAVELVERGLAERAFVDRVDAGETVSAESEHRFVKRGVYTLDTVTLSTSFPFGLFRKERDVELPGELVIWPRTDRPVRSVATGGGRSRQDGSVPVGRAGARGEYRGLRGYRPGDDPRDIHWRSTARLGEPVVREYEQDTAETTWLCLDTRTGPDDEAQETAVEVAASLAARFRREGRRYAFWTPDHRVDPGTGPGHLERVLDALARVDFLPDDPAPAPPAEPERCVLVSARARGGGPFGDVVGAGGGEPAGRAAHGATAAAPGTRT